MRSWGIFKKTPLCLQGVALHPLKKLFEKSFLRIFKNFHRTRVGYVWKECANKVFSSEGSKVKVLQKLIVKVPIGSSSAVSGRFLRCLSESLPQAFWYRHPKCSMKLERLVEETNRGVLLKIFAAQTASHRPTAGGRHPKCSTKLERFAEETKRGMR